MNLIILMFKSELSGLQESSGEMEFDAFKDYMVDQLVARRKRAAEAQMPDGKPDDSLYPAAQEIPSAQEILSAQGGFDLVGLEQRLLAGYQKRSLSEFTGDSIFSDHWKIEKRALQKGLWREATTFAKANEGVLAHFNGKAIPTKSLTKSGGVDVVSWDALLRNHKNNKYLKTNRTLNDYAMENKQTILRLKSAVDALSDNTGKLCKLSNGRSVYAAQVQIDGKPQIVFSFVNKLNAGMVWNVRNFYRGYY
jgi:hypothetical protein